MCEKGAPFSYKKLHHINNPACLRAKSLQSCLTLCNPMDHCSPPGSFVHGDSPGKNTGVSCHALLQGIFPTQGSSKNTGVSCHALLQGIFPTQGSSPHLLHLPALAGGFFTHWHHLGRPSIIISSVQFSRSDSL